MKSKFLKFKEIQKNLFYNQYQINQNLMATPCSGITLAARSISDISFDIATSGTFTSTFNTADIVDGTNDATCQTTCSLVRETESLRPQQCADEGSFCNCSWNDAYVFYGKAINLSGVWKLDTTKAWDQDITTSDGDRNCYETIFNLHAEHSHYDCFCEQQDTFVSAPYDSATSLTLSVSKNAAELSRQYRLACQKGQKYHPSATPGITTCVDDMSVSDSKGDSCQWYNGGSGSCDSTDGNPACCGSYDDSDFTASTACCACGGGTNLLLHRCADDGNICACSTGRRIFYGRTQSSGTLRNDRAYLESTMTSSSITCDESNFPGSLTTSNNRYCFCEVIDASMTKCADENNSCSFTAGDTIFFGVETDGFLDQTQDFAQVTTTPSNPSESQTITCNHASFGGVDPLPGTAKKCFCADDTECAVENGSCTCASGNTIYYGTNNGAGGLDTTQNYFQISSFTCQDASFGGTTLPGVSKACFSANFASDWQMVMTNPFNVNRVCPSTPTLNEGTFTGEDRLEGNRKDVENQCYLGIPDSKLSAQTTHCPITGLRAFASASDTSASATPVSIYSTDNTDDFWYWAAGSQWVFTGQLQSVPVSDRRYQVTSMYIQVTQQGGATSWLSSGEEFFLKCEPCATSFPTVTMSSHDIIVGKESGVGNSYVFNNIQDIVDSFFLSSNNVSTSIAYEQCDAIYFKALKNDNSWDNLNDPDIVLLTPTDVGLVHGIFNSSVNRNDLTSQSLTINTAASFVKTFKLQGYNSGQAGAVLPTNVIVCGNEQVTKVKLNDWVKVIQKQNALPQASNSAQFHYRGEDRIISTRSRYWFQIEDVTQSAFTAKSHANCYSQKVLLICNTDQLTGGACTDPYLDTSKFRVSQNSAGLDRLQIGLDTPFEQIELYFHVYYSMGKISQSRKMLVTVCGNEIVQVSSHSDLTTHVGDKQVVGNLLYKYLQGQGSDPSDPSNTTIVLDSSAFPGDQNNLTISNLSFSSNNTDCPIYGCDIISELSYTSSSPLDINSISPNPLSSSLTLMTYQDTEQNTRIQIHLSTATVFALQSIWVRCFTASTNDTIQQNAYLQLDLEVLVCNQQSINIVDSSVVEINTKQGASTPITLNLLNKFQSSNEQYCPITSFNVTQIKGKQTQNDDTQQWISSIYFGRSQTISSFDYYQNLVIMNTSKVVELDIYVQAIQGEVTSASVHLVSFNVERPPNILPMFVEPPELQISINVNDPYLKNNGYVIELPETLDLNLDDTVTINLNDNKDLPSFVVFDNTTNYFAIYGFSNDDIGKYEITLTLIDSQGGTNDFEFEIELYEDEAFVGVVIQNETNVEEDQGLKVFSLGTTEILKEEKSKLTARIPKKGISQLGLVQIKFSENMKTQLDLYQGRLLEDEQDDEDDKQELRWLENSIKFYLEPYYMDDDFDESNLDFSWEAVSFEKDLLKIKLTFEKPYFVSPNPVQDQLIIKFTNISNFQSADGLSQMKSDDSTIVVYMPKQMQDNEKTKSFSDASDNLDLFLNILFWIMFAFNLLMSGTYAMDHLIIMINSMQIALHIPFLATILPANIIMFFQKIIPIVMFDVIKEHWWINPTNHMELDDEGNELRIEDSEFPIQIKDIGYQSYNYLDNVGSVYIIVIIYFLRLMMLIYIKCRVCICKKSEEHYKKLYKQLFFSSLYVLFIEGYMEFCIAAYLHIEGYQYRTQMPWGERMSEVMFFICTFLAVVFLPLSFLYVLSKSKNVIESEIFKDTYEMLYHGMKTHNKYQISYYLVFIVRRIFFLVCAFKVQNQFFQFSGFYFSNLAYAIYLGNFMPKVYWLFNWQEYLNEFVTQLVTIQLVFFTDLVPSEEVKFQMGWVLVTTIAMLVGSNLLLVLQAAVRTLYFVCLKYDRIYERWHDPYYMMSDEQIEAIKRYKRMIKRSERRKLNPKFNSSEEESEEKKDEVQPQIEVQKPDLKQIYRKPEVPEPVSKDPETIQEIGDIQKKYFREMPQSQKIIEILQLDFQDPKDWSDEFVLCWLEHVVKLPQNMFKFKLAGINGERLLKLTDSTLLNTVKIDKKSHRSQILREISKLKLRSIQKSKYEKKPEPAKLKRYWKKSIIEKINEDDNQVQKQQSLKPQINGDLVQDLETDLNLNQDDDKTSKGDRKGAKDNDKLLIIDNYDADQL